MQTDGQTHSQRVTEGVALGTKGGGFPVPVGTKTIKRLTDWKEFLHKSSRKQSQTMLSYKKDNSRNGSILK